MLSDMVFLNGALYVGDWNSPVIWKINPADGTRTQFSTIPGLDNYIVSGKTPDGRLLVNDYRALGNSTIWVLDEQGNPSEFASGNAWPAFKLDQLGDDDYYFVHGYWEKTRRSRTAWVSLSNSGSLVRA